MPTERIYRIDCLVRWLGIIAVSLAPVVTAGHHVEHDLLSPDLDCHMCVVAEQGESGNLGEAVVRIQGRPPTPSSYVFQRPCQVHLPRAVARAPPTD